MIRAAAPPLSALRALCGGKLFMRNRTSRKSIRSHKILTRNHTFRTKNQKVMYLVNFRKCYSQTPTSSLIFKPITKLVTTFFHVKIYCKVYLLTYLSLKEFKDHFLFPSIRPSVHPSVHPHNSRLRRSVCVGLSLDPEGRNMGSWSKFLPHFSDLKKIRNAIFERP